MNIKIRRAAICILIAACLFLTAGIAFGMPWMRGEAQTVWAENTETDADADCFKTTESGTIDGYPLRKIVTSNVDRFGLTKWAAHIENDQLMLDECMKFEFVTPLDTKSFKSIDVKFRYGAGACFYIYPLSAQKLEYSAAVQSVRTTKSVDVFTLSLDSLAQDGLVNGFYVQLKAGAEHRQFFIDSITPKKAAYTPDPVEDLRPFEWTVGEKADADSDVFASAPAGSIGQYTSPIISIDNLGDKYPEWGMKKYACFGASNLEVDQFIRFEFKTPMNVSEIKSFVLEYKFTRDGYFYVYPFSTTDLCYENAVQGFMSESGVKNVTLSAEALAENGQVKGFIVQLKQFDGDPHQFFVDSLTPTDQPYVPGEVDNLLPFGWEADVEADVDKEVIVPTSKAEGAIGEFEPLTVYLENLNNFGITGYGAFCSENMKQGQFLRYRFVKPIDTSVFKSAELKVMHNSPACFYLYPLDVDELTFENAVQSFRTAGGIETHTVSLEKLAKNNVCNGFIVQLKTEAGVQFFLDSITVHTAAYTPAPVEDLKPFAWEENVVYDADPTIFMPSVSEGFEEYQSLPVAIEDLSKYAIGITNYGAFSVEAVKKNQFLVFRFVNEIDATVFKNITIDILHTGAACYYVYPLHPITMEYEGAVQSFRTKGNGLEKVTLSSDLLSENGKVSGFIVQLRTEEGAQFFIDSVSVGKTPYTPDAVEDLTEPDWKESEVRITGMTLVREYETGAGQDLLKIQFNRNIFSKNNEMLMNLQYLENAILINGKSLKQAGIGVYALRGVFSQKNQVALFFLNNKTDSLKNDGYDTIEIKSGFAIQGSSDDFTLYTVKSDSIWYTNRVARNGEAVQMSAKFNPPIKVNTPLSASIAVADKMTVTIVFDKPVGKIDSKEMLPFIFINGKPLSQAEAVTLSAEDCSLIIALNPIASKQNVVEIRGGLKVGESTVKADIKFTQMYADEEMMFNTENANLLPYWIYGYKNVDERVSFTVHFSQSNPDTEGFVSKALEQITLDGKPLNTIENYRVDILGNEMQISLPSGVVHNGTVLAFESGFMLPSGTVSETIEYVFDEVFEEFFVQVNREAIETLLKPTEVVGILRGTDGVQAGTNELFVEFNTPCSHKYLPYTEADSQTIYATYGLSEVNISERYIYELSRYGIRESLYDNIVLDGKTIREHALADRSKDGEWKRFIDCYYLGNVFNDYTMQIAIGKNSGAVMDWSKEHTVTFKKGLITPTLCVLSHDQTFRWDVSESKWFIDTESLKTVDPDAHLKEDVPEEESGCNGMIVGTGAWSVLALTAAAVVVLRRKKNA